jgi:hypothetical protein
VRAALFVAAVLGLPSCARQDAALLVTFQGGYRIPQDADTLVIDVREGTTVIEHRSYGLEHQASPLHSTLTLVKAGAPHQTLRIDGTLTLQGQTMGIGRADAAFQDGKTVEVTVAIVPP